MNDGLVGPRGGTTGVAGGNVGVVGGGGDGPFQCPSMGKSSLITYTQRQIKTIRKTRKLDRYR